MSITIIEFHTHLCSQATEEALHLTPFTLHQDPTLAQTVLVRHRCGRRGICIVTAAAGTHYTSSVHEEAVHRNPVISAVVLRTLQGTAAIYHHLGGDVVEVVGVAVVGVLVGHHAAVAHL